MTLEGTDILKREPGMDDVIVAKPEMSPKKRALIEGVVVILASATVVLIEGGHPYSNWFYVLMGTVIVAGTYRALTGHPRQVLPANPPRAVGPSLMVAVGRGLLAGLFMFAFILTLNGQSNQLIGGLVLGGLIGVQTYRWERGKTTPLKGFIIVSASLLLIMTAFVLFVTSRSSR